MYTCIYFKICIYMYKYTYIYIYVYMIHMYILAGPARVCV